MNAHKPSGAHDYFITLFLSVVIAGLLGAYLLARRGYMFAAPLSAGALYVPNKVLAGVSVVLIGISFLIGPVTRYFNRFDGWLNYRKEIGIVGGLLGIIHGIVSAFFVPNKFTLSWLLSGPSLWTAAAGIVAALIFAALFVISFQSMMQRIGGARWWFFQRWGLRIGVAATLYHVIIMKWDGWERWWRLGDRATAELANPWMAPANLLVMLFLVWVTSVRLYESMFLFRSLGWGATREISQDASLLHRGRRFVQYSLAVLGAVYAVVLLRFVM